MKLKLSTFSAYARPEAHLTQKTIHGAAATIAGLLLATTLFIHELSHYASANRLTKMSVDVKRRHDLQIKFDFSFAAVPCASLSIDVLDVSGTAESDTVSRAASSRMEVHKVRLDAAGRRIERREYHAPHAQDTVDTGIGTVMKVHLGEAFKAMQEVESEAQHHEGCRMHGSLQVRRVAGRMIVSVHQQDIYMVMPQLLTGHQLPKVLNFTHTINKLAFGPEFPGQVNPLDGYHRTVDHGFKSYKYFLKIVATEYHSFTGRKMETHQYSVSEYAAPLTEEELPSLSFGYDLSPIVATISDSSASLLHFIVRLCAVIGGVFALTGMLDRWVHRTVQALR